MFQELNGFIKIYQNIIFKLQLPKFDTLIRRGKVAIDFESKKKLHLLIYVIKHGKYYYMWFSSKNNWLSGSNYKMCFAKSKNGFNWTRIKKFSEIKRSKRVGILKWLNISVIKFKKISHVLQ